MLRRIDLLADLGTSIISFSGGEPLLHPELDELIVHIRQRGAIAGMITNGYLLTADRIQRLNRAGLEHMQISIDNVMPDDVSKKSLKVLDKKLQLLAEHAEFHVNINSVVGGGIHNPHDARRGGETRRRTRVHFHRRHHPRRRRPASAALADRSRRSSCKFATWARRTYARMNYFQDNIAHGRENKWKCRAGARYLYICEDGLVHYCSQQRGYPATPLDEYTVEDIRREFLTEKGCAPRCTVACVHYTSYMDFWRAPQTIPGASRRTAGDSRSWSSFRQDKV